MAESSRVSLEKAVTAIQSLSDLEVLIDEKRENGFINNWVTGKNPFDADGRQINGIITGLVPNVARGLFGEVGVLTDADIRNYKKLFPTLSDTEAVRDLMLSSLYRTAQRSFENKLEVQAGTGVDVSGMAPMYNRLKARADEYEQRAKSRTRDPLAPITPTQEEVAQINSADPDLDRFNTYFERDEKAKAIFPKLTEDQITDYFVNGYKKDIPITKYNFK
jgi:hypothetical protein